ncbi:MAG: hypothetical protein NT049_15075 [Planctomycetota bacterium]|nr:hypothetical protein [Planctomycetota bacterium]
MRSGGLVLCIAFTIAAGLALAGAALAADTAAKSAAEAPAKAAAPAPASAPAAVAPAPAAPAAKPAPAKASTVAGGESASDAKFFAELGYKDVASAHDMARALVILKSEGKESTADFDKCKAYLQGCGVLPDGWLDKVTPDEPVDKCYLAALICRTLEIKGGLWMHLFGCQPRLALRECLYHELMVSGADYAHVTGGELVGVIDRCDRWRAKEAGREVPKLPTKPATEEKK